MDYTDILTKLDDGILTVTLNRPATYNAFDMAMIRVLRHTLDDAAVDPGVRVVVLTGAGKSFCSGSDVRAFGTIDEGDPMARKYAGDPVWTDVELRVERLLRNCGVSEHLHAMGKPTLAMVRGIAAGAGVSFAAACDFRIASETASFSTAYARIGTSGDLGCSYFLTKLVGPAKARELIFFSDKVDAATAFAIGLVNRVVPDERLEDETMALARRLAKGPPVAYRLIKENINAAETESMRVVMALEARNMLRCLQTEDSKEAVLAFREKREPIFRGR